MGGDLNILLVVMIGLAPQQFIHCLKAMKRQLVLVPFISDEIAVSDPQIASSRLGTSMEGLFAGAKKKVTGFLARLFPQRRQH